MTASKSEKPLSTPEYFSLLDIAAFIFSKVRVKIGASDSKTELSLCEVISKIFLSASSMISIVGFLSLKASSEISSPATINFRKVDFSLILRE